MSEIRNRTTDPPGSLPRNAQFMLMAGISALILVMSFCSGLSGRKQTRNSGGTIASATPADPKTIAALLAGHLKPTGRPKPEQNSPQRPEDVRQGRRQHPGLGLRQERDPIEELERQRRARAPYAPSTVISTKEPEQATSANVSGPVVLSFEDQSDQRATRTITGTAHPLESGQLLPDREGSLYRIYEGTLIRTALTNRLDGTFTGPVICTVTEPVLTKDKKVLIPAGARFLGEARRVEERTQRRLAVFFERLLLPNGYSVVLEKTPGLNEVGDAGLKGKTNNHYLRRFSLAGTIGLLGGLRLYGARPDPYGFESSVLSSIGSAATNDLTRRSADVPTITIPEGHVVNVYVGKDLLLPEYPAGKGL